jgi:putative iron-regulated protein
MRFFLGRLAVAIILTVASYSTANAAASPPAPTAEAVVKTYADIAQTVFNIAYHFAGALKDSVDAFLTNPNPDTLTGAREAWKAAHSAYLLSEGFRFGNPIVDEWEPRVNAWPLDEGLIDYVAPAYGTASDKNPLFTLNIIANTRLRVGAKQIDASRIDKALLQQLQAAEGVESNVATGYHAIEFLLWGQDLHGTGPGAGERPYTDYDLINCTHGNCDRRAAYLKAAVELLRDDLAEMRNAWGPSGAARTALLANSPEGGLAVAFTGLGSLTYGELAGERMKLALILHDPEEEQDCFSDQTHIAHLATVSSMVTIWRGGGAMLEGRPFLRDYVMAKAPEAARALDAAMDATVARFAVIREAGDSGRMAFDQMIGANNPRGNKMVQDAIDALVEQKRAIDAVVKALGLNVKFDNTGDFENAGRP